MSEITPPPDAPAISDLKPVRYVTFEDDGTLDGCYMQVPPEAHAACMIVVDEVIAADWPHYRANAARDGVEPVPPAPPPPPTREELKQARQVAVDAITVTVNGKVFDGDEISQGRMVRALRVADITGQTSCTWVLHDNSAVEVTRDELAQALSLAMEAQGAIWVIPA
jgi:hypothetical protein